MKKPREWVVESRISEEFFPNLATLRNYKSIPASLAEEVLAVEGLRDWKLMVKSPTTLTLAIRRLVTIYRTSGRTLELRLVNVNTQEIIQGEALGL